MAHLTEVPFAELAAKTNYSFLEGASTPEEIVDTAKSLGYSALGITDTFGVYGVPRAHVAALKCGLPLVVGAELCVESSRVLLMARNRKGYGDLCELLTLCHDDRDNPRTQWNTVFDYSENCFLLMPAWKANEAIIPRIKNTLGDRFTFLVSRFLDGSDKARIQSAECLSRKYEIPCVASNQPLFHLPDKKPLQDVLTCLRNQRTLRTGGHHLLANNERHLKTVPNLIELFQDHLEWVEKSAQIASHCHFSLSEIRYSYPTEWIPAGETGNTYLEKLAWEGAHQRYGDRLSSKVERLLRHELELIHELEYSDYFLTIWDIVQFAKAQNILCQGRGSAANSLVCYVLGITSIDPAHLDLLFERFISRQRHEPPDIDIDFEHERREEVIQYIYRRYGRHRAAITAEVICFRRKSALREVGKVFEIEVETVEKLQTLSHRRKISDVSLLEISTKAPHLAESTVRLYLEMVRSILAFPRHLGTHVGGFVLCEDPLNRNVPIEKTAMPNRTIVQWDKNDLDALGFVRVDILGLGILTAIRKCFEYVRSVYHTELTLATLPREDPLVYEQICLADTVGVFQIESRAQMNMLPRLKPRTFYDLVIEISLVRPGPIQGNMVHPYLKRRTGEEAITYAHPLLEPILKKTCGVPLFQEQIMKMAMAVAGFSAGEADELRRAMGSWRRDGGNRLTPLGDKFRKGLVQNGVEKEYAENVFSQIEGFAEYGFPESHAASFAVLVYATAYLKHYYPDAFLTALLNSQPMGFYSSHSLIYDGIRHGVKVLEIDAALSLWDNALVKPHEVRLGFREVRGLRKEVGIAIEKSRKNVSGPSLEEWIRAVTEALQPIKLTKRDLFLLAGTGAFQTFGLSRREAFWFIQSLYLEESFAFNAEEEKVLLPNETSWEAITQDYQAQGVSLTSHPMAFFREQLRQKEALNSMEVKKMRPSKRVSVAGLVICRQMPPTASGVLFITLEDEEGYINLVVWKSVFDTFKETLLRHSFLFCEGRIQKTKGAQVFHVVVEKALPLLTHSDNVPLRSHDFH
jgi:error-prone DNA polymerase